MSQWSCRTANLVVGDIYVLRTACSARSLRAQIETAFPGEHWQEKSPAELGLDADRLDEVATALGSRGCVIKNGYVVKAWGSQSEKSDVFSSAKPVLSTLLLFALQEGKIQSVDQPIVDFGWDLLPKDRTMTFRHLGSMTSGYARPEEPGKAWAYNDYAIQLYQKTVFDKVFKGVPEEVFHDPAAVRRIGSGGRILVPQIQPPDDCVGARLRPRSPGCGSTTVDGTTDRSCRPSISTSTCGPPCRKICQSQLMRPRMITWASAATAANRSMGPILVPASTVSIGGSTTRAAIIPTAAHGLTLPPDAFMSLGHRGNCSLIIPSLNLVVVAAEADWGQIEAGQTDCKMNQASQAHRGSRNTPRERRIDDSFRASASRRRPAARTQDGFSIT